MLHAIGKLIVGSAVQLSAGDGFSHAAPLLEEESDAALAALVPHGNNPLFLHGPGTGTALASDDHPIDSSKVQLAEIFEQGLDGEEADGGIRFSKMFNARETVFLVLGADTPPDVRLFRGKTKGRVQ